MATKLPNIDTSKRAVTDHTHILSSFFSSLVWRINLLIASDCSYFILSPVLGLVNASAEAINASDLSGDLLRSGYGQG